MSFAQARCHHTIPTTVPSPRHGASASLISLLLEVPGCGRDYVEATAAGQVPFNLVEMKACPYDARCGTARLI